MTSDEFVMNYGFNLDSYTVKQPWSYSQLNRLSRNSSLDTYVCLGMFYGSYFIHAYSSKIPT